MTASQSFAGARPCLALDALSRVYIVTLVAQHEWRIYLNLISAAVGIIPSNVRSLGSEGIASPRDQF